MKKGRNLDRQCIWPTSHSLNGLKTIAEKESFTTMVMNHYNRVSKTGKLLNYGQYNIIYLMSYYLP